MGVNDSHTAFLSTTFIHIYTSMRCIKIGQDRGAGKLSDAAVFCLQKKSLAALIFLVPKQRLERWTPTM